MNKQSLQKIAAKALFLITEQIEQGIDAAGKRYSYSTQPFARPYDRKLKNVKSLVSQDKISVFESKKTGNTWILVKGGYKAYRALTGRNPEGDFLQDTGAMLQSMSARIGNENTIIVYFNDPKQAEKAFWLSRAGVGKRKRLWQFMNLTEQNQQELAQYAATLFTSDEIGKLV